MRRCTGFQPLTSTELTRAPLQLRTPRSPSRPPPPPIFVTHLPFSGLKFLSFVAVLPEYFITRDLAEGRLVTVMPKVKPLADRFRLIFRGDDPRRSLYASFAEVMNDVPLR